MNKVDVEKWLEDIAKSSGHKKVVNYIRAIIDTKEFQDLVKDLRIRYGIPPQGFNDDEKITHLPIGLTATQQLRVSFIKKLRGSFGNTNFTT